MAAPDIPIPVRDRQRLPEPMTEQDLEDFLTEAIGFYATPVARVRTFAVLRNRGLVVGVAGAEFRISDRGVELSGAHGRLACSAAPCTRRGEAWASLGQPRGHRSAPRQLPQRAGPKAGSGREPRAEAGLKIE